jgi:hypothetical protein
MIRLYLIHYIKNNKLYSIEILESSFNNCVVELENEYFIKENQIQRIQILED